MSKLHAFGDSFTYGSDLSDCGNKPSLYTWTSLLSNHLEKEYVCYAKAGSSNQTIVRKVFDNIHNIKDDDTVVVNWTWIDRWDFFNLQKSNWETVRPDSVDSIFYKNYYKYFQSELWDKFETLKAINLISNTLENYNIKLIMTCIDKLVFDTTWHCPKYIENLQDSVKDKIIWFDGLGFYDWAKYKQYKISDKWHPLEEAHKKAFEYINEITK